MTCFRRFWTRPGRPAETQVQQRLEAPQTGQAVFNQTNTHWKRDESCMSDSGGGLLLTRDPTAPPLVYLFWPTLKVE